MEGRSVRQPLCSMFLGANQISGRKRPRKAKMGHCSDVRIGAECIADKKDVCDACGEAGNYYGLDIDNLLEELFHELERVQDGRAGHHIAIKELNEKRAYTRLCSKLSAFFLERLYLSDEYGNKIEERQETLNTTKGLAAPTTSVVGPNALP